MTPPNRPPNYEPPSPSPTPIKDLITMLTALLLAGIAIAIVILGLILFFTPLSVAQPLRASPIVETEIKYVFVIATETEIPTQSAFVKTFEAKQPTRTRTPTPTVTSTPIHPWVLGDQTNGDLDTAGNTKTPTYSPCYAGGGYC